MSFFGLDAPSTAARFGGQIPGTPAPGPELVRGAVGGAVMSVGGFAPWAFAGRILVEAVGEAGFYSVCALAFIGLSGIALHRLLIGTGSLWRFYKLFTAGFLAYSAAWIAGWMALRGDAGSLAGLGGGALAMALVFGGAFGTPHRIVAAALWLFAPAAAGYFLGGIAEGKAMASADSRAMRIAAMLLWGLCYGIGLGIGIAGAIHACQAAVLAKIRAR
ncbi:MAG: hypothetical protein R3F11_04695 [Verrucomicrobiales bacterium]